ncbi:hypothetical protein UCRPA7_4377 [Phaeoacremonium minimum UCRPA7]|uniref:Uncharacterized protein n=1 Tax=Phaeoacremonium minimum (strain UCR-PA7) TaxID=1286976 RepID=R8BL80_PHAM7|nr:hypothetical protein UCRPA7_4377 [Phaeoacremonium minimum UCRPA7]EOO00109.1 hypothetical protein UCRPA7_4377 [Phaeoacremonium minimum UCRPA7]
MPSNDDNSSDFIYLNNATIQNDTPSSIVCIVVENKHEHKYPLGAGQKALSVTGNFTKVNIKGGSKYIFPQNYIGQISTTVNITSEVEQINAAFVDSKGKADKTTMIEEDNEKEGGDNNGKGNETDESEVEDDEH